MDVERPYTIDEDEDGSFMDKEDAVGEGGIDPLDLIEPEPAPFPPYPSPRRPPANSTDPPFNGAYGGSSDWAKQTLDIFTTDGSRHVETADELRATLMQDGVDVEDFKRMDAYRLALDSGNYPWLKEL